MKYSFALKSYFQHNCLLCILFLLEVVLCSCDKFEDSYLDPVNSLEIKRSSHVSASCQSMAAYDKYLFLISDKESVITLYDLESHVTLCQLTQAPHTEMTPGGAVQYHCNHASFGLDRYSEDDIFPLLYLSQRGGADGRCLVEVIRIVPDMHDGCITSFSTSVVQRIFLPVMTDENALGNANVAFNIDNGQMVSYSRNNRKKSDNYLKCHITTFDIPSVGVDTVYLEDNDILDSYEIECSALNMQDGVIYKNKLYIGQGYESCGFIYLRVVDLNRRALQTTFDLLAMGVKWEPEGCTVYKDQLYMYGGRYLFTYPNLFILQENTNESLVTRGKLCL